MLALFAVLAFATSPMRSFVAKKNAGAAISANSVRAATANNSLFALLGGYRAMLSDFIWIKAYIEWERRELAACIASLELATSIDPAMTSFWTQGAFIIAFDTPHWIMDKLPQPVSAEAEKRIRTKQAKDALKYLDNATAQFPDNARLWISKGQIYIVALKDYKGAQTAYANALRIYGDESPIYLLRIYAAILARNGEFKAAAETLRRVLDQLEPDSPIKAEIESQIKKAQAFQLNIDE